MKTLTLDQKRRLLCLIAIQDLEESDLFEYFWDGVPGYSDYSEEECDNDLANIDEDTVKYFMRRL